LKCRIPPNHFRKREISQEIRLTKLIQGLQRAARNVQSAQPFIKSYCRFGCLQVPYGSSQYGRRASRHGVRRCDELRLSETQENFPSDLLLLQGFSIAWINAFLLEKPTSPLVDIFHARGGRR